MNEKRVKLFASLAHSRYRKEHGMFLVEGKHAVESLLDSDWSVVAVVAADDFEDNSLLSKANLDMLEKVNRRVIDRIATTTTPQDILAVAELPRNDLDRVCRCNKILVVDRIRDPGNLGTMIRSAEALGFEAVVSTAGSVDMFNPKVVRATQGSMFFVPIAQRVDVDDLLNKIKSSHELYSLSVGGETDLSTLRIVVRSALIVGSEISGVQKTLLENSHFRVRIPIIGKSESLNAAVAAGIAMYLFGRG